MIKRLPGIYRIKCLVNNRSYIGSSTDMHRRIRQHMEDLRQGDHHNWDLQQDFNIYGANSFRFEPVEVVPDKERLSKQEQRWLDREFQPYNIVKTITRPSDPEVNRPFMDFGPWLRPFVDIFRGK